MNTRRFNGTEPPADEGSATVGVLAVGLALVLMALSFAMAGAAAVARHKAQAAADLAALGGALRAWEGEHAACRRAADITVRNGARMTSCRTDGLDVVIEVEVAVSGIDAVGAARAAARAGPVETGAPRMTARPWPRHTRPPFRPYRLGARPACQPSLHFSGIPWDDGSREMWHL